MPGKKLVLVDFDGTLTQHDSLIMFTKHYYGVYRYLLGMLILSPFLVLMKVKLLKSYTAKKIYFTYFFRGLSIESFGVKCRAFIKTIDNDLRKEIYQKVKSYQDEGARIVVVSASASDWVGRWSSKEGFEFLCTELEVKKGKLTGKIAGENCNYEEKVNRIKKHLNLEEFDNIIAFGNSPGDYAMLSLANEKYLLD